MKIVSQSFFGESDFTLCKQDNFLLSIYLFSYCGRHYWLLSCPSFLLTNWLLILPRCQNVQPQGSVCASHSSLFPFCLWLEPWNSCYSVLLQQSGKVHSIRPLKSILFLGKNRDRSSFGCLLLEEYVQWSYGSYLGKK